MIGEFARGAERDPAADPGSYAKAILNILEDAAGEKIRLEATQKAILNILDDSADETARLADTQRAALNILEDFDVEKKKVEQVNLELARQVAERTRLEERFRRLVASSPNALVIVDQDGRITLVNARTLEWFGYTRDELEGQPVELLVPARFGGEHPAHRRVYLASPVTRPMGTGRDLFARRKDGSEFPVDVSLSAVEAEDGIQVIAAISDMTERKKSEDMLRRAKDAADAANKELEAFSYSVSHDLRAPLRSIDGFSQALLEDYAERLDEPGRQHLARVRAATVRMGGLIDDLLQLSRVTRAEMLREPVNLSVLAESIMGELQRTEPARRVDVTIQPGLQTEGDPNLLRIVLVNLLSNAWKFTGQQPAARIELGAWRNGDERAFFVRDNGVGFDMAYAPKLFGAFQRLHAHEEFPGTGIGLATVQRIVNRHGGRVWAEAAVDQGSTFYFALPPTRST